MSKSLSVFKNAFLAVLLAVPMMFMFAACDPLDTQASCSKSNNYTESSAAALNEKVGETTPEFADGYRMTMTMTSPLAESQNVKFVFNAIITKDAIAIKVTGKDDDGTNMGGSIYVTDGKIYVNETSTKTKSYVEVNTPQKQDVMAVLKEVTKLDFSQYNLSSILETIKTAGTKAVITQDGNRFKIVVTTQITSTVSTTQTIWINFDKNGNLEAFETDADAIFAKINVVMSKYNGKVELPSFNGYEKTDSFDFMDNDE